VSPQKSFLRHHKRSNGRDESLSSSCTTQAKPRDSHEKVGGAARTKHKNPEGYPQRRCLIQRDTRFLSQYMWQSPLGHLLECTRMDHAVYTSETTILPIIYSKIGSCVIVEDLRRFPIRNCPFDRRIIAESVLKMQYCRPHRCRAFLSLEIYIIYFA
jgi:hypothetical protein